MECDYNQTSSGIVAASGADCRAVVGRFDVVSIGRAGVDVYPLESGKVLADVERFGRFLGGSATNVAAATSRLGHRTAIVTRIGDDDFGTFILQELRRLGIATDYVRSVPGSQTPLTFCELFPPDHFPLYFYAPSAPYFDIETSELPMEEIAVAPVFWSTLTGLAQEPSRSAHIAAWESRGRRDHTVLDLDYRERFWASRDDARRAAHEALTYASVAIGNVSECALASGWSEPEAAADWLLERGVSLAIVKMGPAGMLAKTALQTVRRPAIPVDVVNGLGAGDAFGGAVCHGLLQQWSLDRICEFANAAGALVTTRLACADAMPTVEEVMALLALESVS